MYDVSKFHFFFFASLHQAAKNNAELVILQQYALRYFDYIVELLDTVPSDLLLLLKTNDCLRHLDKTLRTPVNSTTGRSNIYVLG